ncbi:MAG: DNA-binding transcriptional MerR regulator, partial [Salibacteraceae bacterium]
MRQYAIKDLERISGVKAGTIRIWEQRYNLLQPMRTETNIRYYQDNDLKKLLNVSMLLEKGMRISRISQFDDSELKKMIAEFIQDGKSLSEQTEFYIQALLVAMLELDEARFNNLFEKSVNETGFLTTITEFIYPFLVKIGMMFIT